MKTSDSTVLVIEGVDCVGKTTLAKAISARCGYRYLYTPQPPLSSIRKEVEALDDPNTRFFYYLTSVVAVQKTIQADIGASKNLVIDRYIRSTLVMHQVLGVDTQCVDTKKLPILYPTLSILLTAKSETRAIRRKGRDGIQEYDQRIEQSVALLEKAQETFRRAYRWSLIIETDDLSAEQVEQRAMSLL